jgi:hypothetical protein
MKIQLLDAHDRLIHFNKTQAKDISECCQDLIKQRPFGDHAFYIFAHARTDDDGTTKRLIWQPRLTRPRAQTNSMLFKGYPGTDLVSIIWMIPDRNLWSQYDKGKLTESSVVSNSIHDFLNAREKLEASDPEDLSEQEILKIYAEISQKARK